MSTQNHVQITQKHLQISNIKEPFTQEHGKNAISPYLCKSYESNDQGLIYGKPKEIIDTR